MGGYGSGRRWGLNAKKTTDDFPALDVRELRRGGLFNSGRVLRYVWLSNGQEQLVALVREEDGQVEVYPLTKEADGSEQAGPPHSAPLAMTLCNYGGTRAWLRCPHCSRRVAILYVAGGLACRNCLQLRYQSQREVDYLRAVRRARKLYGRMGGTGTMGTVPARPKGMWWRTYQRLANEAHEVRVRAWAGVAGKLCL